MWRATLPNKKTIGEHEREIKHEVDRKHEEDSYEFTRKDILAMIIAAYQIIMPLVLLGGVLFGLFTFLFLKFFLK
ncbi:hypothetical protein KQI42_18360 [Tissierella sp. MSJ-40]|uniref:Uncharacterized protein n=1 Tax=Tissierella simiarum TaxID=2841534 RepID=A0ABS6EB11_9FIRM|nr:hypothetical protein [Tissierella simiarum]MBU5439977.1 hypothetical protein [Tissierella simiarum]